MIEEKGRDLLAFRGLFLSALMKQLKILVYLGAVMVLCQILVLFPLVFAPNAGAEVDETLRSRIEEVGACPTIAVEEEMVYASMALPRFYERRGYRLAWSQGGDLLPQVSSLIHALREAHRNGLRPDDYHVGTITALVDKLNENGIPSSKTSQLVDLDLLLTDAFLVYASHLLAGRIDSESFDPQWHANRREGDLAEALEKALEGNNVEEALEGLLPEHRGYFRMREALASYRGIASQGGWPFIPEGPLLRKEMRDERVKAIRSRLVASGDLDREGDADDDRYDTILLDAVKRFQKRHGLDVDGVIGPATRGAMSVPVEKRVDQIESNLERWRWLPQNLGARYIVVNIAGFTLDLVESENTVLSMRVVVGRDYRRTPVFSSKVSYLVFCPYWNVPRTIAVEDKLPIIKNDPGYLERENIKVFQGGGAEAVEIDPQTVDWSAIIDKTFSYRLRQEPGPLNALGRIKFMFPNKYDVYLHDTPARALFDKTVRTFSSGCIRVEHPVDLALYLLQGDASWTWEMVLEKIEENTERTVRLADPIAIHLLYWTAWADEEGMIHFRNDIYGRDALLDQALAKKGPCP